MVSLGIDNFFKNAYKDLKKLRLGVLCNPASLRTGFTHISKPVLEKKYGLNVTCFIGPQHGIRGEKQDNMVESEDFIDPVSGLPVFSLYSNTREPKQELLDRIDAFLIDLPDIGARIYTFVYTMANCMRTAKRAGKKVFVLDRPNPIDGVHVEGNCLETNFSSFVGQFPIPARHGMTIGELALLFNEHFGIGCDLEIVKMTGWSRKMWGDQIYRDWVPPSPNIPNFVSALLFPGTVHFEGTQVSEGRGTTRPFEFIGAPYISPDDLAEKMNKQKLKGIYFRPIYFQPCFQKWKDTVCGGVGLHVTDRNRLNAFEAGVKLLVQIASDYPTQFKWKSPPYEYETVKMPIDLIAGTAMLREVVEGKHSLKHLLDAARQDSARFLKLRKPYLLYR